MNYNKLLFVILLVCTVVYATPSFHIDIDYGSSGVQDTFTSNDTGGVITINIMADSFQNVFSYQYKVWIDTSKFSYGLCAEDYGFSGTSNVLKKNNGAVIGGCQVQQNPGALDTIDFYYSITGSQSSQQVSGSGLAGVFTVHPKLRYGQSGSVNVVSGQVASIGGEMQGVVTGAAGVFRVAPLCTLSLEKQGAGIITASDTVVKTGDTVTLSAKCVSGSVFIKWQAISGSVKILDSLNAVSKVVVSSTAAVSAEFDISTRANDYSTGNRVISVRKEGKVLNVYGVPSGAMIFIKTWDLSGKLLFRQARYSSGRVALFVVPAKFTGGVFFCAVKVAGQQMQTFLVK